MMMPQEMTLFLFCFCLAVLTEVTEGGRVRGVNHNVRATEPRTLAKKETKEVKNLEEEVEELMIEVEDLKDEVQVFESGMEEDEVKVPIFSAWDPNKAAPPGSNPRAPQGYVVPLLAKNDEGQGPVNVLAASGEASGAATGEQNDEVKDHTKNDWQDEEDEWIQEQGQVNVYEAKPVPAMNFPGEEENALGDEENEENEWGQEQGKVNVYEYEAKPVPAMNFPGEKENALGDEENEVSISCGGHDAFGNYKGSATCNGKCHWCNGECQSSVCPLPTPVEEDMLEGEEDPTDPNCAPPTDPNCDPTDPDC